MYFIYHLALFQGEIGDVLCVQLMTSYLCVHMYSSCFVGGAEAAEGRGGPQQSSELY